MKLSISTVTLTISFVNSEQYANRMLNNSTLWHIRSTNGQENAAKAKNTTLTLGFQKHVPATHRLPFAFSHVIPVAQFFFATAVQSK